VRILVDYRPALRQRTGVGEYAHELTRALCRRDPHAEVTLFSSSWKDRLAPDAVPGVESWLHAADGAAAAGSGVRIEPDPALGPGDFILETNDGFLDGRVESQLEEAWRLVTELPRL
jgi:hypothetical protein